MPCAAAVETDDTRTVSRISNEFSESPERFEPVSRLLERFEQETEKMLRRIKVA